MTDEQEVWSATVDSGTFAAKVVRTGEYAGQITVTVIETEEVLLDEAVTLSYNAFFGPDVADVSDWQDMALTAIDNYINRRQE